MFYTPKWYDFYTFCVAAKVSVICADKPRKMVEIEKLWANEFILQQIPISITFDKVRILKTKMQIQIGFEKRWTR